MNVPMREELLALTGYRNGPCISLYMPIHHAGAEAQGNPVMLKNLLRRADALLVEMGVGDREREEILAPGAALLAGEETWGRPGSALAMFLAPGMNHICRLPYPVEAEAKAGDRFYLVPLLPLLSHDREFYLLTLNKSRVRLYRGTRATLEPVELTDTPLSLEEANRFLDAEREVQFHAAVRHTGARGGGGDAVFHGNGGEKQSVKEELLEFFQQLDKGVRRAINTPGAPLLLAGVEFLLPIYRQASHYPHLLDQGIARNTEPMQERELHEWAWTIIEDGYRQNSVAARERMYNLLGSGRASTTPQEIARAAPEGRVDQLLIAMNGTGQRNGNNGSPAMDEGAWLDVNQMVLDVLAANGSVQVVDPGEQGSCVLGAVFRY